MNISFIVPAYNEEAYLADCLKSIARSAEGHEHEIIVVDNMSTDATVLLAKQFPDVRVLQESKRSIAAVRQRGLASAVGDIIASVDADCRLSPQWVNYAVSQFAADPKLVCLIGMSDYYDMPSWKRWLKRNAERFARRLQRLRGARVIRANGGNTAYRASALRAAGGFDNGIAHYGEDVQVAMLLRAQGIVRFDTSLTALTSARRFHKEGLLRVLLTYKINSIWQQWFGKPLWYGNADVHR